MSLKIITPPTARDIGGDTLEGIISRDLVELTERLVTAGAKEVGGVLGGQYGYGADFETEHFRMHPYCWCESDACSWCGDEHLPNFYIKGTPIAVHWYKWIGRGMEIAPADLTITQWREAFHLATEASR